ncbi:hypothetical protein F5B17DRAFT_436157 [Nemania serpens]|nr:hypothetical protein F5B17DRAFT_436157 [Nemania serpens]
MVKSVGISGGAQQTQIVKLEALDASQSYFSQVPNFRPDDDAGFEEEFGRFASSQNIIPGSSAWRQQRTKAIRHEVIFYYSQQVKSEDDQVGDDNNKIEKEDGALARPSKKKRLQQKLQVYQNMCREVGLEPLNTIDGCVANLKSKLVNIVDYIDAKRCGSAVVVWEPEKFEDFKRYTLAPDKRIDQEEARGGDGFLAALLQNLRGSNAAKMYGRRRDAAAIARDQHTNRVSGVISGQRATTRPFAIKQESCLGDTDRSVKQKCPVISIHGSESDLTSSPERNLKEESVADGGHEVFSIHDSESNFSSPGRTMGEGIVDIRAASAASSIASLLPDEIPCSSQKRMKRKLYAATQVEDCSSEDGLASRPAFKRFRNARSLELC